MVSHEDGFIGFFEFYSVFVTIVFDKFCLVRMELKLNSLIFEIDALIFYSIKLEYKSNSCILKIFRRQSI